MMKNLLQCTWKHFGWVLIPFIISSDLLQAQGLFSNMYSSTELDDVLKEYNIGVDTSETENVEPISLAYFISPSTPAAPFIIIDEMNAQSFGGFRLLERLLRIPRALWAKIEEGSRIEHPRAMSDDEKVLLLRQVDETDEKQLSERIKKDLKEYIEKSYLEGNAKQKMDERWLFPIRNGALEAKLFFREGGHRLPANTGVGFGPDHIVYSQHLFYIYQDYGRIAMQLSLSDSDEKEGGSDTTLISSDLDQRIIDSFFSTGGDAYAKGEFPILCTPLSYPFNKSILEKFRMTLYFAPIVSGFLPSSGKSIRNPSLSVDASAEFHFVAFPDRPVEIFYKVRNGWVFGTDALLEQLGFKEGDLEMNRFWVRHQSYGVTLFKRIIIEYMKPNGGPNSLMENLDDFLSVRIIQEL